MVVPVGRAVRVFGPRRGVEAEAASNWTFRPPKTHDDAWIASHQGMVATPELVSTGEAVVFAEIGRRLHNVPDPVP